MPKSAQPWVLTLLRTIFEQPDAAQVHAQFDRVVDALAEKFPAAAEHLDAARADLLAFTVFPRELWRQIWSNNPQERLNKEIRRRTDVVGAFTGVLGAGLPVGQPLVVPGGFCSAHEPFVAGVRVRFPQPVGQHPCPGQHQGC